MYESFLVFGSTRRVGRPTRRVVAGWSMGFSDLLAESKKGLDKQELADETLNSVAFHPN